MKASKKQELARQRNWALYQVKSAQGNLVRAMRLLGMNTASIEHDLKWAEASIKSFYKATVTTIKD